MTASTQDGYRVQIQWAPSLMGFGCNFLIVAYINLFYCIKNQTYEHNISNLNANDFLYRQPILFVLVPPLVHHYSFTSPA